MPVLSNDYPIHWLQANFSATNLDGTPHTGVVG